MDRICFSGSNISIDLIYAASRDPTFQKAEKTVSFIILCQIYFVYRFLYLCTCIIGSDQHFNRVQKFIFSSRSRNTCMSRCYSLLILCYCTL